MLKDNVKTIVGYKSFKGNNDILILKLLIHV
jgi:hypothetical protein